MFNVAVMTPYRMLRMPRNGVSAAGGAGACQQTTAILRGAPHAVQCRALPRAAHRLQSSVRLERVRAVKRGFGVKLNDVALALVAGALRRFLQDRGELPERAPVAQVPVSTRGDSTEIGNQISSMTISIATDVGDARERMNTIHGNTQGAKEMAKAMTAHQIMGLTQTTPPGLLALAARAYTASHVGRHVAPINLVMSNVPGWTTSPSTWQVRLSSMSFPLDR